MADTPEIFTTETTEAIVEAGHGGAGTHVQPELFGLAPFQIVSIAMLVLLAIAFLFAKVHRSIAGGLDARIAAIREQLDDARSLRAEAEALRDEYSAKIANAELDAAAMRENAEVEARAILAKAESEGAAMVERRQQMAKDRIAAAEREAIGEVRASAAQAAARASRVLIARRHDPEADRRLTNRMIAEL